MVDVEPSLYPNYPSFTYTTQILLQAGHTYGLFNQFDVVSDDWVYYADKADESDADMSNTGQLFIDAPAGSFTTLSGHDYSTDAVGGGGASGAPEPATWAMLIIGFVGVGFAARFRTARISANA